jgi:DNA polymerase I-like protein with 3'-5' exonuclease and polymerase domains
MDETISIDLETKDPGLKQRGPGFTRREGHVVGLALATAEWEIYLPIAHPEGNLAKNIVCDYVVDCLKRARQVVFANAGYDIGWMDWLGLEPLKHIREFYDVLIGEALIDEEMTSYSLESTAQRRLGIGKDETLLKEAAAAYGVDHKNGIGDLPARYVGRYAEMDVRRTFDIAIKQKPLLTNYTRILELENKVLPLVYRMHRLGIPVNLAGGEELALKMEAEENRMRMRGRQEFGANIAEWSGAQIAKVADSLKLQYPKTANNNPSFTSDFLSHSSAPFFQLVNDLRDINKHRSTFVDDWIFGNAINGRIHPQWHQMASDEGGTKTGRMSCSQPNAQQVPKRSKWGAEIRKLFVPDPGLGWAKLDYSQQEPRILTHYGMLEKLGGTESVSKAYLNDPKADIYKTLADAAGVTRSVSKTLTLGSIYGMGLEKLAHDLNITEDAAEVLRNKFNAAVPFVRELTQRVASKAELRGEIRTLGGRVRHFNFWEPNGNGKNRSEKVAAMRKAEAEKHYGSNIKRAYTYKALNSLIQGSAADMTKMAMVNIYQETGLVPYMAVHDELNYGVKDAKTALKIKECMEHAYKLQVPIIADLDLGETWK